MQRRKHATARHFKNKEIQEIYHPKKIIKLAASKGKKGK